MKIIVNDANVLIDLIELHFLQFFFQLEYEFHTTSLILDELLEEQIEALSPYINSNCLIIDDIETTDLHEILKIRDTKSSLSEQDCSAFYQAQKFEAALITSDNTLRRFAKENDIEVHGHLWVFDNLVSKGIISGSIAILKLEELCNNINPKLGLPKNECQKRKDLWCIQ